MAIESLYTTETPTSPNNSDLGNGSTAGTFVFGANGNVLGVRFFATTTVGGTYTATLWRCDTTDGVSSGTGTGTLLATSAGVASGSITPGAWNTIMFAAPVAVVTTNAYRAQLHTTDGRYVALAAYFNTPHTNGNVTGPQSGSSPVGPPLNVIRNGSFVSPGAVGAYANAFVSPTSYLVDVLFEASGSATQVLDTPGAAAASGASEDVRAGVRTEDTAGSAAAAGSSEALTLGQAVADLPGSAAASGSADVVVAATVDVVVLDTSDAAAAAGSPDVVLAEILYQEDTSVWPALDLILACLVEEMAKVPNPPAHVHMRPGDFVSAGITNHQNECCEGLAWMRVTSIVPTMNFPAPVGDVSNCPPPYLAVGIELGASRCAPAGMNPQATALTTGAEWRDSVRAVMADAAALRRVACCLRDGGVLEDVIVGQWVPLPLEANCTGGTMTLTVRVPACDC